MPVRQKVTEQKDRVFCVEITDEAGLCQIKEEWEELFEDSVSANVFATWHWTYLWWKNFSAAHSGTYLHLLVHAVYEETGRLIGVAPLYYGHQRRNRVRYRGLHEIGHANIHLYEGVSELPCLLLRTGCERKAIEALLDHLRQPGSVGRWDYVKLQFPIWEAKRPWWKPHHHYRSYGWKMQHRIIETQHLHIFGSWEEYRNSLSKSMRDNLAYYPRLLTRHGYEWQIRWAKTAPEVEQAADILVDLHRLRAESEVGTRHIDHLPMQVHRAFLKECLPKLAESRMASISLLEVQDKPIAAQCFLEHRGMMVLYYSGFQQDWHSYSPLTILFAEAVRDATNRGVHHINLLRGRNYWKTRWGTHPEPDYHWLSYIQPNPASYVRSMVFNGRRIVKKTFN
jgi:hypothetical protein